VVSYGVNIALSAGEGWVREHKTTLTLKQLDLNSPHPTLPSKGGLLVTLQYSDFEYFMKPINFISPLSGTNPTGSDLHLPAGCWAGIAPT